jgi:protein-tyrosine phosphatase
MSNLALIMENKNPENRFHQLLNFRDIGSTINAFTKTSSVKSSIFYRSARPDEASASDRAYLTQALGIKTIIDLRSTTEHIKAAEKYALVNRPPAYEPAAVIQSNQHVSSPLRIPDISYTEINLNGGSFERALLWQLKYTSLVRLLWLIACGNRDDAISILGREVMVPRGLIGLAIDTLDCSTSEIRDVFNILSDEMNYPVMIHCTQGKDRTGLIVVLVLMLCGVDGSAIADDYMRSEEELLVEKKERLREISRIGLNEDFVGCPRDFVLAVTKHIQGKYGGIGEYLAGIGVDAEAQERVRRIIAAYYTTD